MRIWTMLAILLILCSGCYRNSDTSRNNQETEPSCQQFRATSLDSLLKADGVLAVPFLPQYVLANSYEMQKGDATPAPPFLLKDDIILHDVYPHMLQAVGMRQLTDRARSDSAYLRETFPSALFVYLAGNPFLRYPSLYALVFYSGDSGVLYYVCDSDVLDDSAIVQMRPAPSYLPKLISEVAEARIPSRPDIQSEGTSSAIVSFLANGAPQVVAQRNAMPFHSDPDMWVSEWIEPYMPGRVLIDSLIWGIANTACGIDPRLEPNSSVH